MFMMCAQAALRDRCIIAALSAAIALLFAFTTTIRAETACVRCTGPEVTYLCETSSADPLAERAAGLYCAAKLAAQNDHSSCAAQRDAEDCKGIPVSVAYEEQDAVLPDGATQEQVDREEKPAQRRAVGGEPETLGEFAEDTAGASADAVKNAGETIGEVAGQAGQATKDALEGAGRAIGDATKKTWKCLGSALNDC